MTVGTALNTNHNSQPNTYQNGLPNTNQSDKKERSQGKSYATRNITRMVVLSIFVSIFCQIPYSVSFIIGRFGIVSPELSNFNIATIFFLLVAPSTDFFVYFFFNKLFKSVFISAFKKIFHQK